MRCAECGQETPETSQYCALCGAPVSKQRSMPAESTAGVRDTVIAAYQQAPSVSQETPYDASAPPVDWQAGPGHLPRTVWAIFGLVIIVSVVIGAVASSTSSRSAAAPAPPTSQLTVDQLRPGNCLTGSNLGLGTGSPWPDLVAAVPCTHRHLAEVFFAGNAWPQSLTTYPGDNAINNQAYNSCFTKFTGYDGIAQPASNFSIDEIAPSGGSDWASGDRLLVCLAYEGIPVNYSIKGSHR
jgi:hypothetical protein